MAVHVQNKETNIQIHLFKFIIPFPKQTGHFSMQAKRFSNEGELIQIKTSIFWMELLPRLSGKIKINFLHESFSIVFFEIFKSRAPAPQSEPTI